MLEGPFAEVAALLLAAAFLGALDGGEIARGLVAKGRNVLGIDFNP